MNFERRHIVFQFYDSDAQRLNVFMGNIFRPSLIISSGPTMLIRFFANGGTGLGYRANIAFLSGEQALDNFTRPHTDCGGYVETLGGAITMMDMINNGSEPQWYNCIWLIRPPSTYLNLKTHLSLRIDAFETG